MLIKPKSESGDVYIDINSVFYYGDIWNYAIALLADEQGQYVVVQDRYLQDGNDGTDTLRRVNQVVFNGQSFGINPSQSYYGNYLFSSYNQASLSNFWLDLDGNVALTDQYGNPISSPGPQGNQQGDDLIIGFNSVYYYGEYWKYAIALLTDEQGQYVVVQDRYLEDGNDGTDTLRRVNQIFFNGQSFGINPSQSYYGNYLFSSYNQASLSNFWLDLDGNVALTDQYGNPISSPGPQGNQQGDDLIIGFNSVYYYGEYWKYAIALLTDEQGQYVVVQDRYLEDGNDGTDTLRRVNQIFFNGQSFGINPSQSYYGNYLFSAYNQASLSNFWLDLDGNVALTDQYGNPISSPGPQGNQQGDDLIIGFNSVYYYGEYWKYAIALLTDEQGQYVVVQDRYLQDGNDGTDTLRRVNQVVFNGQSFGINPSQSYYGNYLFSSYNQANLGNFWLDLDGNVALSDPNTGTIITDQYGNPLVPSPGQQGNQRGDDLIIGFNSVEYYGEYWKYAIALLTDEQGQYVVVQDRYLQDGNDGTDTLRRVNQVVFNGQSFGINPSQSYYGNYLFSSYNQANLSNFWLDLDGNVALSDPNTGTIITDQYGNPLVPSPGQQGNQRGDDLIIGFNSVEYYGEYWKYAIALLTDEQGQYVVVQDRYLQDGNDGTDTLRRVNQVVFNGQSFGINPSQSYYGNYLFSSYNQANLSNFWLDLDGNVALSDPNTGTNIITDQYGNPLVPSPGQQGNQRGDDLIIGFNSVEYYGEYWKYAIALLTDEQGQYVVVQDRYLQDGNDGTDTLRRVNQVVFNGQSFGINPSQSYYGNYLFSSYNQANLGNFWLDLDGNVALSDPNTGTIITDQYGNPLVPSPGQQGNQRGDDLIIGFNSVEYYGEYWKYAIALLTDEQGQYVVVQDRYLQDGNDGTDTLRRVNQVVFNGQSFGINPSQSYYGNYLFSSYNQANLSNFWLDLDGNVALSDTNTGTIITDQYGNPLVPSPGQQGNQRGDDLIIGFNSVEYYGEYWKYAIALLTDEQGQYVVVQDRYLQDGNDGTDTLRRVNQVVFNGQSFGINPSQSYYGNYLFSSYNQANLGNFWLDLDGNVALSDPNTGTIITDQYGNPLVPSLGQQGNQRGDDLIIGFNSVEYYGEYWKYAIALLTDEQGQYVVVQDRYLQDGNDGTDTLRRVNQVVFNGQSFGINPSQSYYGNYLFSSYNQANLSNFWLDLDGNVALSDPNTGTNIITDQYGNPLVPSPGQQGNQRGDDLIIGFNSVEYYGEYWKYAIALLTDEQGQYVVVQDRYLQDGNDGTDTLRRVNQVVFNGQSFGINPSQSYYGNYLFSSYNQANLSNFWLDLDGNVALSDPNTGTIITDQYGNPLVPSPGQQGNQRGDDLIIGFNSVEYYGEYWKYAIALLTDEQGQYVVVQDRYLQDGNDGTDTLRRVNQVVFNGQSFGINPSQSYYGNYLFSSYNQANLSNFWLDLDGNVALSDPNTGTIITDQYGNPLVPSPGQQGNQRGDDLIIGFNSVSYAGPSSDYSIAILSDEYGQFAIISDANSLNGNDGIDILRTKCKVEFSDITYVLEIHGFNAAPVVTSVAIVEAEENIESIVYKSTASDPDPDDNIVWTLGGIDATLFNLDTNTGEVIFKASPNHEEPSDDGGNNVYDITLTASDGIICSAPKAVTIIVSNVNEAPVVISGASASFVENRVEMVYQAVASDPDGSTSSNWSLGGYDANLFNIDTATGAVTFKASPNYEVPSDHGGNNVYEITVMASDGYSFSEPKVVSFTVQNINESPTGSLRINGTPLQGQTLSANSTNLDDPEGIPSFGPGAISYQWNANGSAINGATGNSLLLTEVLVDKTISVSAFFVDGQGTSESLTSAATAPVVAIAPVITSIFDNLGTVTGLISDGGITNDTTPTLSGTIPSPLATGSTLRIYRNDVLMGSATISGAEWMYTPTAALASGTYRFNAAIYTSAGVAGPFSAPRSIVLDTTAPIQTVTILSVSDDTDPVQGVVLGGGRTNDTTPTITGTLSTALGEGEYLRLYRGTSVLTDAVVDNTSLTWSATTSLTTDGAYAITARVIDIAGNQGPLSASRSLILDTSAPLQAVAISAISDNLGTVTGPITDGGITNDTTPTVTGTFGGPAAGAALAAGETLRIYSNGAISGTAIVTVAAAGQSTWTYTPASPLTTNGTYSFSAQVIDGAGNSGPLSAPRSIVLDTTAPIQTVTILSVSDDTDPVQGVVLGGGRTNDTTPTITGTLSTALGEGEYLRLYRGTSVLTDAVVDNTSLTWSATTSLTTDGAYAITARVIDIAGNQGPLSASRSLILDTSAPLQAVAISAISDNLGTVTGPITDGGITNDTTPTVTGTFGGPAAGAALAAGETLRIYSNGAISGTAIVTVAAAGQSTWTYTPASPLTTNGTYSFSAQVIDGAGNSGPLSAPRSIVLDTTAPIQTVTILSVSDDTDPVQGVVLGGGRTNDTTPTITGTLSTALGEGEYLRLYRGTSVLTDAVVDNTSLTWSATTSLTTDGAYAITARVIDIAGNQGPLSASRSLILDTSAPLQAVAISAISDNLGTVTGPITDGGITNDTTPTVTGTFGGPAAGAALAAGETLRIYSNGAISGTAIVTVAAAGQSTWTYTPASPLTTNGTYSFSAQVIDGAGNSGPLSAPRSIVLDALISTNARDNLVGMMGASDIFLLPQLSSSLLGISDARTYDTITNFEASDKLQVSGLTYNIKLTTNSGTAAGLDPTQLTAVLPSGWAAKTVRSFKVTGIDGTFVGLNNSIAGFQSDQDSILFLGAYNLSSTYPITII